MFRQLFGIGDQFLLETLVFFLATAAPTRPGDGAYRDLAVLKTRQNLR